MALLSPRWYFDADVIGLGKLLSRVRRDVTWPGDDGLRPRDRYRQAPCPVQDRALPDEEWIPQVTLAGMAIITRDARIRHRTAELRAVVDAEARLFAITGSEKAFGWELLEIVVTQWRAIEKAAQSPGPFLYDVHRTRVTSVDLDALLDRTGRPPRTRR